MTGCQRLYIWQPVGFEKGPRNSLVCRVEGSLYGLDPSAKIWYDTIVALLLEIGSRRCPFDSAFYIYPKPDRIHLYIIIYVDDFSIFAANKADADWFVSVMTSCLEFKDLQELQEYLGLHISRSKEFITMSQHHYISSIASDFNLDDPHPVLTPLTHTFVVDDIRRPRKRIRFFGQMLPVRFRMSTAPVVMTRPASCAQWETIVTRQ